MRDAPRFEQEAARIDRVYAARSYDSDPAYADADPVQLQRAQCVERAVLGALRRERRSGEIGSLRVLDYGCGNGTWFGRWLAWGATPANLTGSDTRQSALTMAAARFPTVRLVHQRNEKLDLADGAFDVATVNLVFSSILDSEVRATCAREIARVLRPGGLLLWYDFTWDNPRNPDVRGVRMTEVKALFAELELRSRERVVLAPPLARRLVPRAPLAAQILERAAPFLRTHLFAVFRKPDG